MATVQTLTVDKLEAQVFQTTSPIVLNFYQASCPPCRTPEPRWERVAQQYIGRLPAYRVGIGRDLQVAENFEVKSVPTVLIVCAGNEIERLAGLITDDDLKAAFERAIRV